MGRRKIEIQPITHERNRSVTFLKRKNGLFKKAYELGVLCSVDVAVIIFEERPGHHVKLYQYCSTDVHGMVQRHMRFDGEKDTRTPNDFNNTKTADAAEDDEDGDDDDGGRQGKAQPPANKQTKVKSEGGATAIVPIRPLVAASNDVPLTIDLDYRNARASPTNGPSSTIPVSGERHSTTPAGVRGMAVNTVKRPRLLDSVSGSADVQSMQSVAMGVNVMNPNPNYSYVDMSPYASPNLPLGNISHPHATAQSSMASLYPSSSTLPNMISSQNPHPNFLAHAPPSALRTVSFPPPSGSPYQHQQPLYRSPIAQQHPNHISADLLNAQSQSQFPSFDWPVHQQQQQQRDPTRAGPSSADSSHWFDLFSQQQGAGIPLAQAQHARSASGSISSQRPLSAYSHPPSSSDGTRPQSGHKRGREDEAAAAAEPSDDERARRPGTGMSMGTGMGDAGVHEPQGARARPPSAGERAPS